MPILKGPRVAGFTTIAEPTRFSQGLISDFNYPLGDTYYVRNNGSDSGGEYTGLTTAKPFKTLAHAVAVAGDFDRIIIMPSTDYSAYLETSLPILVTQKGLKILGLQTSEHTWGSPAIHTHATTTLIQVNAPGVEIANLSFHQQGAGCSLEIAITDDTWRAHVHDCFFGGNATALYGIVLGNYTGSGIGAGHTVDACTCVIERCHFYEYATAAVVFDGDSSVLQDCVFFLDTAAAKGVLSHQANASRAGNFILNNRFITNDASNAVGISFTATPGVGTIMMDGNRFVGFADDNHRISTRTGLTGLNYGGVTAVAIT